jgi:hypothetical protein
VFVLTSTFRVKWRREFFGVSTWLADVPPPVGVCYVYPILKFENQSALRVKSGLSA